jgi:hypothetical protein
MTVGDLNGDGHLDFVSSGSEFIGWRTNDGQGNFGDNHLVTTELDRTDQIVVGDLDGDGDNDVVAVSDSTDDELIWFENRDGQGTFGPKQTIAEVSDRTWALTSGDLDGDADLDLVRSGFQADSVQYVEWFENVDASGRFERRRISDKAVFSIVIVDLDQDGDPDIVTENGWLENVGGQDGFIERAPLIELDEPDALLGLIVDDVDHDGRLDLFATLAPSSALCYEATDDPTAFELRGNIQSDRFYGDRATWYPGDVDGDGDTDFVVVDFDSAPLISQVHWYELVGTGYVYRTGITSGVGHDWSLIVADLNGDLRDDVLFYHGNGLSLDAYAGRTPTTWQTYNRNSRMFGNPVPINDVFHSATAMATADIDGDGDLDVIHSTADRHYFSYNADVAWIENLDGSHAFGRRSVIYTERLVDKTFQQLWPRDIDGDGDVDIAATKSGESVWFENLDGKGHFGDEHAIEGVPTDATLLVHDLDSDGRAELLAVNRGMLDAYAYEAPGVPWRFVRSVLPWSSGSEGELLAGDLDGDGDQDLAFSKADQFSWFERLDSDSFAAGRPLASEVGPGTFVDTELVALADFDGDQDLDVVYSVRRDPRRALTWLENQGQGRFIPASGDLVQGSYFSQYALADLDGDDDFDIVMYDSATSGLRWAENRPLGDANGDGQFNSADLVHVLAAGKYEDDVPRNTTFDEGDWNGDGDFTSADLVLVFQAGNYVGRTAPRRAELVDSLFQHGPFWRESHRDTDAMLAANLADKRGSTATSLWAGALFGAVDARPKYALLHASD